MAFADLMEFLFWGWALGFFFAVAIHFAAKAIFAPLGIFRMWSGPD